MERREGVDHSDLALASVCGLSVRFGATTALDGVDLDVRVGEVHAVVGENGAGKSTLVRAVAGVVQPRRGAIRLRDAARLAWVPQEAEMPPDLCVGEWIFLGTELRNRFGLLRQREMREQAVAALRAVRAGVSPEARLGELARRSASRSSWRARFGARSTSCCSMNPRPYLVRPRRNSCSPACVGWCAGIPACFM